MTDEIDLVPVVRAWFEETSPPASESSHIFDAAIGEALTKPQQRHPWPPLPLPALGPSTSELTPAPVQATGGPTPAREFTMISAVKFVAAATIVALFGGLLYVTLPTDQGTVPVAPAAVSTSPSPSTSLAETDDGERTEPVYFAGDLDFGDAAGGGCMSIAGGGFCSRRYSIASDVSGARLAGEGEAHTMWPFEGGHPGPHEGRLRIENEHGAWNGVLAPRGESDDHYGVWFVGEDGYEGLTAFMYATAVSIEEARGDMHWEVDGWLFTDEPVAP